MNRLQFAAAASSAIALGPRVARAAGSPTIRVSAGAVEEFAQPYFAAQKGFFRDAGLNVELLEDLWTGGKL